MNVHKIARRTPRGRGGLVARAVEKRQSLRAAADGFGVTIKAVSKRVGRFEAGGRSGLADHSSRPHRLHRPTPPETAQRVIALRRQRFTGQQIAWESGVSPAT